MKREKKCPLCGGDGLGPTFPYLTKWNGTEFRYVQCVRCGTAFVVPLPSDSDLALMYAKENYHDVHYPKLDPDAWSGSLATLREHCGDRRTLLDFGCGNGGFLVAAKQVGFDCCGVEYDAAAIASAQRRTRVPVLSLDEMIDSGRRFDIIHLADVLEHMRDPKRLFSDIRELLCPGGIFFVEGPLQNNASLVYFSLVLFKRLKALMGMDRPGRAAPTHLILTNTTAQRRFFTHTMACEILHFNVTEDGWPCLSRTPFRLSIGGVAKQAIGRVAVLLSKTPFLRKREFGNRFSGVFRPHESSRDH